MGAYPENAGRRDLGSCGRAEIPVLTAYYQHGWASIRRAEAEKTRAPGGGK